MRTKKSIINISASIFFEFVRIVSAFLIPRLILHSFGSDTNGITQAVSQFIGYISLLTAGVGSVTTAALYKPIAEKKDKEISGIVRATEKFLRKVSFIFVVALLAFAATLPFFISEFDYFFTFTLVVILGIGTFANYYFGLTYRMILNADQKQYIHIIIQSLLLIIQTTVAVLLINSGRTIHTVQLISALIFLLNPIFIYLFVRKKYNIDKNVGPNNEAINQRWDAFGHQIANFVNNNTDLLLLTIFVNLKEVSVYSIYFLVFNGIRTMVLSSITGTEAAFGNMFAKNEIKNVEKSLTLYEFLLHTISIILYSSMALLITPFVGVYTSGITDINYNRPLFGYLISIVGFFVAVRLPYQSVTRAAGHFKQTRNGAIFEAILNITLSIILVIPFGMIGLVIGTLAATIFRTIQYALYSSKKLLDRNLKEIIKRYIISFINVIIILFVIYFIPLKTTNNYVNWIINAFVITGLGVVITGLFSFIFYFDELIALKNILFRTFKKQKQ